MGLLTSLFEKRSLGDYDGTWGRWTQPTAAGVQVDSANAMQSIAVYACVRVLSESIASLPLILYERLQPKGKNRATNHNLYPILHDLPNPEMTSMELRETLVGHQCGWGNAYAEIEYSNGGKIKGLWPLRPDKTKPKRVNGQIVYMVDTPTGQTVGLPFNRVMHIKGLGYDGMVGYNPIHLARQAIGLSLATEEFGARFFGNGARPGAVLEHPGRLGPGTGDRLRSSWEMMHKGLENSHRVAILEEGMKLHEIGIPPEDAQFLETRKFQKAEIASLYRVPLHLINDLEHATFSNIEHMSLEFVMFSLMPWFVRWEQAIYRDLLSPADRLTYFAQHLVAGLLRGDLVNRYNAYAVGRQNGWLSANDIRELEDMNPIENGDMYLVPLNMVPADQAGQQPEGDEPQPAEPVDTARAYRASNDYETRSRSTARSRRKLAHSFEPLFLDVCGRVYRREIADVKRAVGKFLGKRDEFQFSTWLKQFYSEHKEFWQKNMQPLLAVYAMQVGGSVASELELDTVGNIDDFISDYAASFAVREISSSQLQLQSILDDELKAGNDPAEAIEKRLAEWEEKRPKKTSIAEAFGALGAFTWALYRASGVTKYRWMAHGENCPYCNSLNEKVIGIDQTFLGKDTELQPEGAKPISIRHDVRHGPLHGGCDCTIVAERE